MNKQQKVVYGIALVVSALLFLSASTATGEAAPQQAVQGIWMALAFIGPYTVARMLSFLLATRDDKD